MIRKWTVDKLAAPEGIHRLTASDLRVVFQPIVDLATGRAFAHEALVRCKLPEFSSPPVLFEHAVRDGFCGRLGRLIRDVTFETCGDVALFVNLHPDELTSHWLVQPDEPIGFHSRPVFLEITETAILTHYELCLQALKEICGRTGAQLVVDDFGAGYSNLDRLATLYPAVVKLDLALIRALHLSKRKQAIVRHMVSLCADLGARVVAEGVEVIEELLCARDLGVQYAQGYLLARPAAPPPDHHWPIADTAARPAIRPRVDAPPLSHRRRTPLAMPSQPPSARGKERTVRESKAPPEPRASTPPARRSGRPPRTRSG